MNRKDKLSHFKAIRMITKKIIKDDRTIYELPPRYSPLKMLSYTALIAFLLALYVAIVVSFSLFLLDVEFLWLVYISILAFLVTFLAVFFKKTTVPILTEIRNDREIFVELHKIRGKRICFPVSKVERLILRDFCNNRAFSMGGRGNHRVCILYAVIDKGKIPLIFGGPEIEGYSLELSDTFKLPLDLQDSVIRHFPSINHELYHKILGKKPVSWSIPVPFRVKLEIALLVLAFSIMVIYIPAFFNGILTYQGSDMILLIIKYFIILLPFIAIIIMFIWYRTYYEVSLIIKDKTIHFKARDKLNGIRGENDIKIDNITKINLLKTTVYWLEIICSSEIYYIPIRRQEDGVAIMEIITKLFKSPLQD